MRNVVENSITFRLTGLAVATVAMGAAPAFAQSTNQEPDGSQTNEIAELRKEVAELRALVSALLADGTKEEPQTAASSGAETMGPSVQSDFENNAPLEQSGGRSDPAGWRGRV
ncbi:MAG: hypothetical protein AAFS13_09990 [Pseudomonadota bacterium]